MRKYILYQILSLFFFFSSCQNAELFELERKNLLITGEASELQATTALITAELLDVNITNEKIVEHGHCWSFENPEPTVTDSRSTLGGIEQAGVFETQMTNLKPLTRYFACAYVQTENGTVAYGNVVVFNTDKNFDILSATIFDITPNSAIVEGTIRAQGVNVVAYGHCWDTQPEPTVEVNLDRSNYGTFSGETTFQTTMSGLSPLTKYYVRAYIIDDQDFIFYSNASGFVTFE